MGLGAGEKRSSSKGGVKTDGSGSENGVGVRSKEGRHTDKVMRERGIGKRIHRYRRTRGEVEMPSGLKPPFGGLIWIQKWLKKIRLGF